MLVQDAHIVATASDRYVWRCPGCRRVLGEVVGAVVVLTIHRRSVTIPAIAGIYQRCPQCHVVSTLPAAMLSSEPTEHASVAGQ